MSFFFLALLLSTAHAVPTQMGHQGRVLDVDGLPAEGPYTLDFHLYDAAEEGTMVWSELHDVDLINGYYSLVLGADELGNPLEDELLRDYELHLELTVGDDEPLSPRQALNAVPYARLSATATSVNGGPVNASDVSIGGALVIDSSGAWVGTTPTMSWSDLSDVPEDVDTVLSEDEVDAFCENNGYAIASDLAAVATSGSWSDLSDVPEDVDTILSEDEVDAFCADNGYAIASDLAPVATSGSWSDLSDVPEDVDTVLSEDEVDAFSENNGYALSSDLADIASSGTNTQYFTEDGTFVVPDGISFLTVYVTGGGGGGSNGESTSLELGTHSHGVDGHSHAGGESHSHSAGSHTHAIGSHTHSETGYLRVCPGGYSACYDSHPSVSTGSSSGSSDAGSGSSGSAATGATAATTLTTNDTEISGTSVSHRGGDGGAGGGVSALISVSPGSSCVVVVGGGSTVVDSTGSATTIECTGGKSLSCTGGAGGQSDGENGLDGSCTATDASLLSQFKASNSAPGGSGLGAKGTGATGGQSGSVTVRY
jgi:hypothetical protein